MVLPQEMDSQGETMTGKVAVAVVAPLVQEPMVPTSVGLVGLVELAVPAGNQLHLAARVI
jgi:hypothetical protein